MRGYDSTGLFRARSAFTLLELLLVLALLVLMVGMAWPLMQSQFKATELKESADRLRTALFMARSEAVMSGRRVRLRFAPGAKQPDVEIEPNPLAEPGHFELLKDVWTQDDFLLGESEVYTIRPGRPDYMKPVEPQKDPNATPPQQIDEPRAAEIAQGAADQVGPSAEMKSRLTGQAPVDNNRPPITFEADGSTGWATIVVTKIVAGQPLDENAPQLWLIIDGRTGLVTIRPPVTPEQLADPTFLVMRDKLEIPPVQDAEDTSLLGVPTQLNGGSGAGTALGGKSGAMSGSMTPNVPKGSMGGSMQGGPMTPATATPTFRPAQNSHTEGQALGDALSNLNKAGSPTGQQNNATNGQSLDQALNNSDLTEQQKQDIINSFKNQQNSSR